MKEIIVLPLLSFSVLMKISPIFQNKGASQLALVQRICLLMQETRERRVQFLGQEDPLEEETATHSSVLTWKIPWQRSLVG